MLKQLLTILMLLSAANGRNLQNLQPGVPVLVNLRQFEVTIALNNSTGVNTFTLQNVVASWMEDGFKDIIQQLGAERFAPFEQVFLTFQGNGRRSLRKLQDSEYRAIYSGVSVWTTSDTAEVPAEGLVASIQLETIRSADSLLKQALQDDSLTSAGVGSAVIGVRAQILGVPDSSGSGNGGSGGDNDGLDVVIIVAIVVACLAFALLGVTLFLAYRRNAVQKEAFKVGSPHRNTEEQATGPESEMSNGKPPQHIEERSELGAPSSLGLPSEDMGGGLYPESLISEDISTSLTAYYRGGVSGKAGPLTGKNSMNDAASVSSMESYGYSLDGYQGSIAGGYQQDTFLQSAGIDASTDAGDQLDVPTRDLSGSAKNKKGDVIEM